MKIETYVTKEGVSSVKIVGLPKKDICSYCKAEMAPNGTVVCDGCKNYQQCHDGWWNNK